MTESQVVEIGNRRLKLSNLDKVLYPATGFTKGQVIDYYVRLRPSGAMGISAMSTSFWRRTCPRWSGWRIWLRWNCIPRLHSPKISNVPQ